MTPASLLAMLRALAILTVAWAAGCATTGPVDSRGEPRGGAMGVLLPRPFGSVSMDESPVACVTGWVGIGAGALVGGAVGAAMWAFGEPGPAVGVLEVAAGVTVGGFLGGLAFTPLGHLLQWFVDLATAGPDAGGEGPEEAPAPVPPD